MPDDCSRTKSDNASRLLKSPTKINIVSSFSIFRIEATNIFKGPSIKRHVTAWDVLSDCIGEQNVAGTARCGCDTGLDPILPRRCNVWSADSRIVATDQRANQIVEPIDVRHAVRVGIGEHFAFCRSCACVARVAQAMIALMDVANLRKLRSDVSGVVG